MVRAWVSRVDMTELEWRRAELEATGRGFAAAIREHQSRRRPRVAFGDRGVLELSEGSSPCSGPSRNCLSPRAARAPGDIGALAVQLGSAGGRCRPFANAIDDRRQRCRWNSVAGRALDFLARHKGRGPAPVGLRLKERVAGRLQKEAAILKERRKGREKPLAAGVAPAGSGAPAPCATSCLSRRSICRLLFEVAWALVRASTDLMFRFRLALVGRAGAGRSIRFSQGAFATRAPPVAAGVGRSIIARPGADRRKEGAKALYMGNFADLAAGRWRIMPKRPWRLTGALGNLLDAAGRKTSGLKRQPLWVDARKELRWAWPPLPCIVGGMGKLWSLTAAAVDASPWGHGVMETKLEAAVVLGHGRLSERAHVHGPPAAAGVPRDRALEADVAQLERQRICPRLSRLAAVKMRLRGQIGDLGVLEESGCVAEGFLERLFDMGGAAATANRFGPAQLRCDPHLGQRSPPRGFPRRAACTEGQGSAEARAVAPALALAGDCGCRAMPIRNRQGRGGAGGREHVRDIFAPSELLGLMADHVPLPPPGEPGAARWLTFVTGAQEALTPAKTNAFDIGVPLGSGRQRWLDRCVEALARRRGRGRLLLELERRDVAASFTMALGEVGAEAVGERDEAVGESETVNKDKTIKSAEASQLSMDIATLSTQIAENKKGLLEATELRAAESAENAKTLSEAEAGLAAVQQAISILETFYQGAAPASMLLQTGRSGAAQLPSGLREDELRFKSTNSDRTGKTVADYAPDVFDADYHGSQEASKGIIGTLQVIEADFQRTISATEEAESQAEGSFTTFKTENEADTAAKDTEKTGKASTLTVTNENILTLESELSDSVKAHDLSLASLEALRADCIEKEETYEERVAKRNQEIEALKEAHSILEDWESQ
ncbi:unnamed protein product [Prorocentrum cordatum]|uniref:Uncharacterized protein n=1 Tax=Prorocentrum cordatum TaxID=2364126 RepID=A0ABN9RIP1_9DINO|nr:unnamed protein product [Polarella glacialis]